MWPSKNYIFPCEHSRDGENILHYLSRNGGLIDLFVYKNAIVDENRFLVREFNLRGQQSVHVVVSEDRIDPEMKLNRLMEWGADINGKEKVHGDTPLHIAVRTKRYKLARWLCQQPQVDIEARNFAQQTPYQLADYCHDTDMMNLLQENGAQRKTSQNSAGGTLNIVQTAHTLPTYKRRSTGENYILF